MPRHRLWITAALGFIVLATIVVYAQALDGPFLFDDHVHITQNRWVKIDSLTPANLARAWNSSFSAFPANRPLAQLSFGINHALSGLDPWAFKSTNLLIHLLCGLLIFAFVRLACRAMGGDCADERRAMLIALAATALWLLHPLHVSTVLYTVQRMAQLSTLSLLAALTLYLHGRLRLAAGRPGLGSILAAIPLAGVGFLAKENAVLLPLLLLVCEITLLRAHGFGERRAVKGFVYGAMIALPLFAGVLYMATHPGMLSYEGRDFTLEERLLTQPRALWFYLKLLFIPDISSFALFHDDFAVSTGLLQPPTTLVAGIALLALPIAAWQLRQRYPVFAFAVLFYLASHALESTVLPLEMVFEHRNYLAAVGPLFLLAYLVTAAPRRIAQRRAVLALGLLLLASYATVAAMRVAHWSSYQRFILTTAEMHPRSVRASFLAGQFFIAALDKGTADREALYDAARVMFTNGFSVDQRCIDCIFGLVAVDLHIGKDPDPGLLSALESALRSGHVGPSQVSVGQFSFLARWQRGDGHRLSREAFEGIFDAAQANPAWPNTGRAGIASAYREYFEFVVEDFDSALEQAQMAVAAWPEQWGYRVQVVRILRKLNRLDEALQAARESAEVARNRDQRQETARLIEEIRRDMSG